MSALAVLQPTLICIILTSPGQSRLGRALNSEHSTAASLLSPLSKLKLFLYLLYLPPPCLLSAQQTATHYLLSALVLLFVIGGEQDQEAGEGIKQHSQNSGHCEEEGEKWKLCEEL